MNNARIFMGLIAVSAVMPRHTCPSETERATIKATAPINATIQYVPTLKFLFFNIFF